MGRGWRSGLMTGWACIIGVVSKTLMTGQQIPGSSLACDMNMIDNDMTYLRVNALGHWRQTKGFSLVSGRD